MQDPLVRFLIEEEPASGQKYSMYFLENRTGLRKMMKGLITKDKGQRARHVWQIVGITTYSERGLWSIEDVLIMRATSQQIEGDVNSSAIEPQIIFHDE